MIGRRVQDGQLPRFVVTPLFADFGVTIDAMLALKAEANQFFKQC